MSKFTDAVKKAKGLYKTGKYKTFADAVKAAYKGAGSAKKKAAKKKPARKKARRVGATLLLERNETRRTKPKRIVKITRTKKGTFKKIGSAHKTGIGNAPNFSDPHAAREIELFYENDAQLYFQSRQPILKNLTRKFKKGTYDVNKAGKLFQYGIEAAMKSYHKQFGSPGDKWSDLLSVPDRKLLGLQMAEEAKREFEYGNFTE